MKNRFILRMNALKIILPMFLLLTACTVKAEINKKILFVDDDYYARYAGDTKTAERYFIAQGFTPMNAVQILDFMRNGTAPGSVILSLTDVSPKIWAEPYDKSCAIYQYCLKGGRFVAPGGNTLSSFIGKDDIFTKDFSTKYNYQKNFMRNVFGVESGYGLRGKDRKLTDYGKTWGLNRNFPQWAAYLDLGVYSKSVTPLVTVQNGTVALAYYKNYNPKYPYSGLIGACFNLRNHLPTLEGIYRLCLFDGTPIAAVPKVDYREKKAPQKDFEIKTTINNIPRNIFECGETIPVTVITNKKDAYKIDAVDEKGNVFKDLNTALWKEGYYTIRCTVNGKIKDSKQIYIAAKRKNQEFPIFIWKSARPHLKREKSAAAFIRKNYLNTCIDDIHQMTGHKLDRLGNVIDETLRYNQLFSARTSTINMFTDSKDDQLVLYSNKVHYHGKNHPSASSRAVAAKPERLKARQSAQIKQLLDAQAPNFSGLTVANDDGSMLGNFDFNPKTMADFEAKTNVKRSDLPKFIKVNHGNQLYFPVVEKGIIPYDHPFLQYFRYHTSNYSKIAEETVKSSHGVTVGDIGLMSGPIYPGRGFYPPISHKNYTINTFYNYTFWYSALAFNIEFAKTAGRSKPWGAVVSAHYTPWGKEFQKGILYRLIANAPGYIGLWHLDESTDTTSPQFKSTWQGTNDVGKKLAEAGSFYKMQSPLPRKCAFLYDIAQICFQVNMKEAYPYSRYCAVENFRRAGGNADIITSEEVMDGILKNYDMIIIHDTQWMTDKVRDKLIDYIKQGGKVIADKYVTIDIPGMEKSPHTFGMGLSHIGANYCTAQYAPFIKKYKLEQTVSTDINAVLYHNEMPDKTPLVWVLDCESNAERRNCQTAMSKNWKIGAFNYLTETAQKTGLREHKLKIRDNVYVYDLFNHCEIPVVNGTASVKLNMLDAVPLLLLKDKISAVDIKSNKEVVRGKILTAELSLKNADGKFIKGMVPAQIKVTKNGEELWAYGGNVIFKDGKASFSITVPVNETAAVWDISIKEFASGKTASIKMNIK